MSARTSNIPAVVSKWSLREKKLAVAAILRELESSGDSKPLLIEDESHKTVGLLMPLRSRVRSFDMSQSTPYVEEIKRRLATADQSIPIQEVNATLDHLAGQSDRE